MTTILALVLACQDSETAVQARVRKGAEGYEVTIRGRGGALEEGAVVRLRFRRIVHRVDWEHGRIETGPDEHGWDRSAPVESGAFAHRESIAVPGEFEVEVRAGGPGPVTRLFRLGQGADLVAAVRSAEQRIEAAVGTARELLEELESALEAPAGAARKAKDLRRRATRRIAAWREVAEGAVLSASAGLLSAVLTDLEAAIDCAAGGKPCEGVVSSVTGLPFTTSQARAHLDRIAEVSVRERALVVVRGAAGLREEIGRAAESGCPYAWSRVESHAERALAEFRQALEELPCGPLDETAPAMIELIEGTGAYFGLAASMVHCPNSAGGSLEERLRSIEESSDRVERALRSLR
jgi:hypothetical protein